MFNRFWSRSLTSVALYGLTRICANAIRRPSDRAKYRAEMNLAKIGGFKWGWSMGGMMPHLAYLDELPVAKNTESAENLNESLGGTVSRKGISTVAEYATVCKRKAKRVKSPRQQAYYGDTSCDFHNNAFSSFPAATKRNGGLRGSTATRSRR